MDFLPTKPIKAPMMGFGTFMDKIPFLGAFMVLMGPKPYLYGSQKP